MIPKRFCLIGQIIRIYADTVSSDKSRSKFQEIPFGSCRLQYRLGIDAHLIKDHGQFIHKSNIDISLAVLNYLGSLCHLDRLCTVYPGFHNQFINLRYGIQCFFIHAGYNLRNGFKAVNLISRINTLRGISDLKIHTTSESGFLLKDRYTDVFRNSRVYS